jgi:hypothetical protein
MNRQASDNSAAPFLGSKSKRAGRLNPSAAVLWASAMIIAALVIMQAGRLPINEAYASTAITRGDYTLCTATTGTGNNFAPNMVVFVIDNQDQVLMVYDIESVQQNRLILRDGANLVSLFSDALR